MKADEAAAELARATALFDEAAGEREAAEKKVSDLDCVYRDLGSRRGTLERELSAIAKDNEKMSGAIEVARRKHAENTEALTHGLAHVQVIESHAAELSLELSRVQAEAEEAAADESAARQAVGAAVQSRDAARAALDEARDTHRALTVEISTLEEVERTSAASAGEARAWLVEHGHEVAGIGEPLSHVVQAAPGFEGLVETLLGADVTTLLVEDAAVVEAVAARLAEAGAEGEVAFLLRDDAERPGARAEGWRAPAGTEGTPLVAKLSLPEADRAAVEALLGDVVVCPSLDAALAAHASDTLALRFVTGDGSVVWPSGKVSVGGSVVDEGTGALARHRRLESLRVQLKTAEEAVAKAEEAHRLAEEALRHAQATSLELSQSLAALRGRAEAARAAADAAAEKLTACRRELEGVERQRAEAEAVISKARPNVESFEAQIAELEGKMAAAKERTAALQEELAPLRREAHRTSDGISCRRFGRGGIPSAGEDGVRRAPGAAARLVRRAGGRRAALDAHPGGADRRSPGFLYGPARVGD